MKLTKRQLRKLIREEKQKLMETDFSSMGEDEIIQALSDEEYAQLEVIVYVLGEEVFGVNNMGAEDAGYCIAVLLQQVFPLLRDPLIKKMI